MLHKKKNVSRAEKKRKYAKMLISLLLAIFLWLYASGAENHNISKSYTIPVEFLNELTLEKNDLVLTNLSDETVTVVLEGKRTAISAVQEQEVSATVDVSGYTEGEYYADISVHAPASVNVADVNPSQVRIKVEKKVTEDREVKVQFKGATASDEEAVCTDYSTEIVKISGASSKVSRVAYLTATINALKLTYSEQKFGLTLSPVDKNGKRVEDIEIDVAKVTVTACLYKTKTVPLEVVTVGELSGDLELSEIEAPENVTLAGPKGEIDNIAKISTTAVDLSQVISSAEVELKPDIPGNVRLAATQNALKAVITVRKIDTKDFSFSASDVSLTGLGKNYRADLNEPSVTVEVRGTENALDSLSSEDFTLSADCSGLSPGMREVPLEVTLSERAKQNDVTVNPGQIELTITS